MKTLILVILTAIVSGCAHQSVHDWCEARLDHYSSYNECYTERTEELAYKRQAWSKAWSGMGQNRQVSCYTSGNYTRCQ